MTSDPQTLPAVVRAAAERFGARDAVVDGQVTLSFADLLDAVRDTARGYLALGLEPGERVALWAPNSWQWEVAALAVTYAGGTLVPLNTRYTGHEAADVVRRTHARFVVLAPAEEPVGDEHQGGKAGRQQQAHRGVSVHRRGPAGRKRRSYSARRGPRVARDAG